VATCVKATATFATVAKAVADSMVVAMATTVVMATAVAMDNGQKQA
jgi:hypothetical protein